MLFLTKLKGLWGQGDVPIWRLTPTPYRRQSGCLGPWNPQPKCPWNILPGLQKPIPLSILPKMDCAVRLSMPRPKEWPGVAFCRGYKWCLNSWACTCTSQRWEDKGNRPLDQGPAFLISPLLVENFEGYESSKFEPGLPGSNNEIGYFQVIIKI